MIRKLNIDLYDIDIESEHNKAFARFIEYQIKYFDISPDEAKAKWMQKYPKGIKQWYANEGQTLNTLGQQNIINKINELIDVINNK